MCHVCLFQGLYLCENQIGDAGLTALAGACASGALAQLKTLYLHENQIGDKGLEAFSGALAGGSLASLETLVMVGPPGADHPQLKAVCGQRDIFLI